MADKTDMATTDQPLPATLPSAAAIGAADEIKAIRALTIQMAQIAEAQIMERLWLIKKEFEAAGNFADFCKSYINIDGPTALRYAATWEGARKNRALRELATADPNRAMAFIQRLTDSGINDDILTDDTEVTRILTLTPRKQQIALRELIDTAQAVTDKRHPADREKIKMLEAERDALKANNVTNLSSHPTAQINTLIEDLKKIETTLAEFEQRAIKCFADADHIDDASCAALVRWADLSNTSIKKITRIALRDRADIGDDQ